MSAKKSNVRKSSSKSGGFKFRWWMAVGLVAVVALVGVLVLRFSRASTGNSSYSYNITASAMTGGQPVTTNGVKGNPLVSYRTISASPSPDSQVVSTTALQPGRKYEVCIYGNSPLGQVVPIQLAVINNQTSGFLRTLPSNDAIRTDSSGNPVPDSLYNNHVAVSGSAWQIYCGDNGRPVIFYTRRPSDGYGSSTIILTNIFNKSTPVNVGSVVLYER